MRVKMNITVMGSPDGILVQQYLGGKIYDGLRDNLPDSLAEAFLKAELASIVADEPKEPAPSKTKSMEKVPENKGKDGEGEVRKRGRKSIKEIMKEKLLRAEKENEDKDLDEDGDGDGDGEILKDEEKV
jgi:hypothetical protein